MQHTKNAGSKRTARNVLMLAGLVVALMPTGPLSLLTSTVWELEVLRLLMVVSVTLIGVWPWAAAQDPPVVRRLYIWVGLGVSGALYYLVSGNPVYLFTAFCLLVGGSLDMWMRRAHMASDELRKRLQVLDRGQRSR